MMGIGAIVFLFGAVVISDYAWQVIKHIFNPTPQHQEYDLFDSDEEYGQNYVTLPNGERRLDS